MTSKHLQLAMQIDKLQRELKENPKNLSVINAMDKLASELQQVNNNLQSQLSYMKRDFNLELNKNKELIKSDPLTNLFNDFAERFKPKK